ncbi:tigger transposable element-derived protein 6-like [Ornithodoros turicata]|uniref:tigger transposable element-derived protein 6-like n=1 Tax=Ornithodoros turicata TaxID=34597 RepID=UPI00313945F9
MAGTKRKRTDLTAGMRKRICVRFKENPSSHLELAEWAKRELSLDVGRSTITTVLKEADKWLKVSTDESNRVRARPPKHVQLERSLQLWFNDVRAKGAIINDAMLTEKAKVYGTLLGIEGFSCSAGWLSRFKNRNGIRNFQLHGEAASVDENTVALGRARLREILASYSEDEIYNLDETGLLFRLGPMSSLATTHAAGTKRSKDASP